MLGEAGDEVEYIPAGYTAVLAGLPAWASVVAGIAGRITDVRDRAEWVGDVRCRRWRPDVDENAATLDSGDLRMVGKRVVFFPARTFPKTGAREQ